MLEEAADLFGFAHIGLDEESIGAEGANFFQGRLRGLLVAEIMNGNLRSAFRELQRDGRGLNSRASPIKLCRAVASVC